MSARTIFGAVTLASVLAVSACGGGSDTSGNSNQNPPPANTAPSISGTPPPSVVQDTLYSFRPTASDPDGDRITFTIAGQPSWTSFNSNNGTLSGTPTSVDLGTHTGISITVTDGPASATLGPFAIEVLPVASGSVTLSWTPPTQNADGSDLNDLAGYRVRWGTQSGSHPNTIEVRAAGVSSYVVDNLPAGQYYFVLSAIDTADNESAPSNEAIATVTIAP